MRATAKGRDRNRAVERNGGNYGAGLIRRFAVTTRGEALGHGVWLDKEFVQSVISAGEDGLIKSRFTHPGLSGDGMGRQLGKSTDFTGDGDQALADLHFLKSAHKTPDGNLAEYTMDMAEEAPDLFGSSIVFSRDLDAELKFHAEHTEVIEYEDPAGNKRTATKFTSPDPDNLDNLPHIRLGELHAVDIVDEPAANPDGLFYRGDVAQEAEQLVSYAIGLTDEPPTTSLDIHPTRIQLFVSKFLDRHNLEIKPKDEPMSAEDKTPVDTPEEHIEPAGTPSQSEAVDAREELRRYTETFGVELGAQYFQDAVSFDDSLLLYVDELKEGLAAKDKELAAKQEEIDALAEKLASLNRGEEDPVDGSHSDPADASTPDHSKYSNVLPNGAARFAAGIKLAGRDN